MAHFELALRRPSERGPNSLRPERVGGEAEGRGGVDRNDVPPRNLPNDRPDSLRRERVGGRPKAAEGCIAATYPPESVQ
jgi:hypothetical protein